ncbi:hypothetical protein DV738_g4780, partial [Chaetothyriales sp. CBS 135597]
MADPTHSHTLNARAYYFPTERDKRLPDISKNLLDLPPEIRNRIYDLIFNGNRVAVSSRWGCYCASDATGPYNADHKWLLTNTRGRLRQEAQHAFIQRAMWEIHCESACKLFLARLEQLGSLGAVRHIRLNVFETSREYDLLPLPPLDQLRNLQTVTFAPWQKGWTIDIRAAYGDGSDKLSDASVMERVREVMLHKPGYKPVRDLIASSNSSNTTARRPRDYTVHFVFPVRYLLPSEADDRRPHWRLRNWRANMDTGSIDRAWREVYLVQEATLD